MKANHKTKRILLAGILSLALSGCGAAIPEEGIITQLETTTAARGIAAGQDSPETAASKLNDAPAVSTGMDDVSHRDTGGSTIMAGTELEDAQLVEITVQRFKDYLGLTINPAEYDVSVTYFEATEDNPAVYSVFFFSEYNQKLLEPESSIGNDGFPLPEIQAKLKPEYSASFSDSRELTALSPSYVQWERSATPIGIEEVKQISKDFLIHNQIAKEDSLSLIATSAMSEERGVAYYQIDDNRAVIVSINSVSGRVKQFNITTPEIVNILISPKQEGYGVG